MRFSEKLSQKVIEDNFNYHTEQTDMQTIYTQAQEDENRNLQQYIDKQQSKQADRGAQPASPFHRP